MDLVKYCDNGTSEGSIKLSTTMFRQGKEWSSLNCFYTQRTGISKSYNFIFTTMIPAAILICKFLKTVTNIPQQIQSFPPGKA